MSFKLEMNKGFTLMEMMVALGIAATLMTVFIITQNRWNDQLAVNTQAYELALMLRQSQVYSLGVKEYQAGAGDKFDVRYGVFMDIDNPDQYIFFVDKDRDQKYDSGEDIETKIFTRGVAADKICDVASGGGETCGSGTGNLRRLAVSFERPNPESKILFLNNGNDPTPGAQNIHAKIYLRSPAGRIAAVGVRAGGQIYVE